MVILEGIATITEVIKRLEKLPQDMVVNFCIKEVDEEFTPEQLDSIERGLADVRAGRTTSNEDMQAFFDECEEELQEAIDKTRLENM